MSIYCGVMSGTSLDGVDVAFVDIDINVDVDSGTIRFAVKPIASGFRPYSERMTAQLQSLRSGEPVDIGTVCEMHSLLGWVYAEAVTAVARDNRIDTSSIAAIGLHGQTVWHAPAADPIRARRHGTLQLGQPAVVAELLNVSVVSDFRAADMAAGGQGAPLVPFADFAIFASPDENRAILNIGGIANLTYLPAGRGFAYIIGFDTGPGNLLIDSLSRKFNDKPYDEAGAIAATGTPITWVVDAFLDQDYFRRQPPKSTGAELFGAEAVEKLADILKGYSIADALATAIRITAKSIQRGIDQFLPTRPKRIIVGGGGIHNKTLMGYLTELLDDVIFDTHEAHGIDGDSKEAIAFALLACARVNNIPANIPSVTGARGHRLLGVVTDVA